MKRRDFKSICSLLSPIVCNQTLAQAQLPEYIHSDVHRCVVSDSEGTQVHDASEAKRRRGIRRLSRRMLGKDHHRSTDNTLLTLSGIVLHKRGRNIQC